VHDPKGEPLALKIFDPSKCSLCRVEREIESMKRCDSPYIGKLHAWGNIPDSTGVQYLFMVEEFFDGGTLSQRISRGVIDVFKVCDYGLHLAQAIEHLKMRRLVHRDIKPDNIMFHGSEDIPALVDFGLVRDLAGTSLTLSYLQQGPGTPFFASPEQLNNEKHLIDWRSDQFAIGVVLGICLTGKHPYYLPGQNENATVDRVGNRTGCSKWFVDTAATVGCDFLVTMISPWPVQRFADPGNLIDAFSKRRT
jgi:serine/threonine protein kinase